MLRYCLAAAAVLVTASTAEAQASPNWSGFYVGANGFGSRDWLSAGTNLQITQISNLFVTGRGLVVVPGTTRAFAASRTRTNWGAGGQVGFQWQTGKFVFGAEADFDPFRRSVIVSQSQQLPSTALTPPTTIDSTRDIRMDRIWSVRARLGYAFGRTLVYATGGYASARLSAIATDSFTDPGGPAASCTPAPCQANLGPEGPNITTSADARSTVGGWRAGLGVDQRLTRHVSIGLEYLHTDFGAHNLVYHSSVTTFGPSTRGDNGATGIHGQVTPGATRAAVTTDSIGVRVNFQF